MTTPNHCGNTLDGTLLSIAVSDPAAATDVTYTVPAGYRLQILGITFTVTTDANAANRSCDVEITDGTNSMWLGSHGSPLTANLTGVVCAAPGAASIRTPETNRYVLHDPLPDPCILEEGWTIGSNVDNFQVGDQISDTFITAVLHLRDGA